MRAFTSRGILSRDVLDDLSKSYVGRGGVTNLTSSYKIKPSIPLAALLPLQCCAGEKNDPMTLARTTTGTTKPSRKTTATTIQVRTTGTATPATIMTGTMALVRRMTGSSSERSKMSACIIRGLMSMRIWFF